MGEKKPEPDKVKPRDRSVPRHGVSHDIFGGVFNNVFDGFDKVFNDTFDRIDKQANDLFEPFYRQVEAMEKEVAITPGATKEVKVEETKDGEVVVKTTTTTTYRYKKDTATK